MMTHRAFQQAVVTVLVAGTARGLAADSGPRRHVIYLHGRIVQEEQTTRPRHPEYGHYELEKILAALRGQGFEVIGEIRPKPWSLRDSAEHVAGQVRQLLESGVPADRITIVGASMGASIALLASVRLGNPDLRFALIGACLSGNVRALRAEEGSPPSGRLLFIRESSDELSDPCPPLKEDPGALSPFVARELVIATGLRHGFLYRPLPEWLDPVVERAGGGSPGRDTD